MWSPIPTTPTPDTARVVVIKLSDLGVNLQQVLHCTGESSKMAKEIPCQENTGNVEFLPKHREFCQKLVMFLCAYILNSLILQIKGIALFAAKLSIVFLQNRMCLPSHSFYGFCILNILKSLKLAQGRFAVRQGQDMESENRI